MEKIAYLEPSCEVIESNCKSVIASSFTNNDLTPEDGVWDLLDE